MYSFSFTKRLYKLLENEVNPESAAKFSTLAGLDLIRKDWYRNRDIERLKKNVKQLKEEIDKHKGDPNYSETLGKAKESVNEIYEKLSELDQPKKVNSRFIQEVDDPIHYCMQQIQA